MTKKNNDHNRSPHIVKKILSLAGIVLLGIISLVFGILYIDVTNIAFIAGHKALIVSMLTIIVASATIAAAILQIYDKNAVYKITIVVLATVAISILILYIVKISGLWDKIGSVDALREYVASYGKFTVPIFIIIQFLQVTVLPIPAVITIGAGVALFGPFYGAIYSLIGIISASLIAFFIGRYLGGKAVSWLIGEKSLKKGLQLVKGKDTIVLTFMFLFPFFPDDILCFVAGLSTMSVRYYIVMITVTRVIGVVLSSYSLGGKIIPFDTWWGITLWCCIFIITCVLCVIIYKNGNKIEEKLKTVFKKKAKNGKNDTSHRLK